jgi:3-dehydroquinate synthase
MIAACWIAVETGHLAEVDAKRISDAVISLGPLPAVTASDRAVLRLLQSDKKTIHGVLHFVLPTKVGRVSIVKDVPERAVVNAVRFIREMSATSRKS